MRRLALIVLLSLAPACGESSSPGLCADDDDALGPACMLEVPTAADFEVISVEGRHLYYSDRITMYMAPAREDPELLPTLLQNAKRFDEHIGFLRGVFPDRFPDLDYTKYMDLVMQRETRSYYSGKFVHVDDPLEGLFYGFTVYTASSSAEMLTVEEARNVYQMLDEVFQAGPLAYTFDPYDAMGRENARAWTDPGFQIYFGD
jgi:hypothetical protein